MTLPGLISATKMSPLGATRIWRGPSSLANAVTVKPGGTLNVAPAGCGTLWESATPGVATSGGRSAGVILRVTPGASARQSP